MASCGDAARLLKSWDSILILSHASPDGDALGSSCALLRGLRQLGKQAAFVCPDEVPEKYAYLFAGLSPWAPTGEEAHIVAVDVADAALLGELGTRYAGRIDLAVDHHGTHVPFAKERWVCSQAAANTELIYALLGELGVRLDPQMANAIYTGLTTDTGCFRYYSVTPETHRIAARVIELGAQAGEINRMMFESKSRRQVEAEKRVRDSMRFFCEGKCAMVQVPYALLQETGATESDLDGVASMPRQIEGVLMGITLKEKENGDVKASLRTNAPANAAEFCNKFGGGGHAAAAGCSFRGQTLAQVEEKLVAECQAYLRDLGEIPAH